MKRVKIVGLLLLASTSGAGAQERYVPKDMTYYVGCLREQAKALDDRVSDARTIAAAAVTLCRASRRDFLVKTDPKSISISGLYDPPSAADIDIGTTLVLQERAARKR
jgi:hypothetical protein